jgi:putative tryptophan/tyrosine transport system substrate-binding protein
VKRELQEAASSIERGIEFFGASTSHDINVAFSRLMQNRPDALLVVPQGLLINHRVQIVTLATRHGLPGIYPTREFVENGGLMSYGANPDEQYRQTGIYTGRILKGEKPAEMPVLRASKFEFIVNLQTAKALDIHVPPALLARADEVIE